MRTRETLMSRFWFCFTKWTSDILLNFAGFGRAVHMSTLLSIDQRMKAFSPLPRLGFSLATSLTRSVCEGSCPAAQGLHIRKQDQLRKRLISGGECKKIARDGDLSRRPLFLRRLIFVFLDSLSNLLTSFNADASNCYSITGHDNVSIMRLLSTLS